MNAWGNLTCRHRYFEDEINNECYDVRESSTVLAGLGTGLLATAAVSLSPTLADLTVSGAEVARIAFRLGVLVDRVSEHLQPRPIHDSGPVDSWAFVMPGVTAEQVQKELDTMNETQVRVTTSCIHPHAKSCCVSRGYPKQARSSLVQSVVHLSRLAVRQRD
jgi:hypothetical protein